MTATRHPLRILTGAVMSASLLLVGCGGDDNDAESSASTPTVENTAARDTTDSDTTDSDTTDSDTTDSDTTGADTAGADTTDDSAAESTASAEATATETGGVDDSTGEDDTGEDDTGDGPAFDGPAFDATLASGYLGSYTLIDEEFGTMVTVTVDGSTRTIETNALPDHATGEFPNAGNPNTITAQDLTWELPTEAVYTGAAVNARTPGIAVNGVKFEPATAETVTCESGETYRVEALQELFDLGLDFNNAHVQPTGEYHYHGVSQLLVDAYESDDDLVHVGFASDGFLIYYSKSGAYRSSYALSSDARTGTGCELSLPGGETFDVAGTGADGTYTSDWVFDETNGDLDSCNGTTIDGQYVYLVTDTYPFVSRCLNGEFTEAGGPGGGAPGAEAEQAGAGGTPDFGEAAAALGISEAELLDTLGDPPPDLEAAAATLGISVDELVAVLPPPPG